MCSLTVKNTMHTMESSPNSSFNSIYNYNGLIYLTVCLPLVHGQRCWESFQKCHLICALSCFPWLVGSICSPCIINIPGRMYLDERFLAFNIILKFVIWNCCIQIFVFVFGEILKLMKKTPTWSNICTLQMGESKLFCKYAMKVTVSWCNTCGHLP